MEAKDVTTKDLLRLVEQLTERVEKQESELHELRSSKSVRARRGSRPDMVDSRDGGISRAGLLRVAGIGAVAVAAAGLELGGGEGTAFAGSGNSVIAGHETKAEGGTMVNYDGSAGFQNAVLAGNDSTYGNEGPFDYPAAVAGLAGAGTSAGPGGLMNGVHGFTDNGAGNGVIGFNTNAVPGSGCGVLGIADAAGSYGVSGQNSAGTGVMGSASSPANFAAGVQGHHNGANGGIGVYGLQDGNGWGGFFASAQGTGIVAKGGSRGAQVTTGGTADQTFAVYAQLTSTNAGTSSAAVRAENDATGDDSAGVWGSQAGGGSGGFFTSTSGNGVWGIGAIGVMAQGTVQGVYGSSSSTLDYASAIEGELTATTSGIDGAGVFGKNDATNAKGCGVMGSHAGGGEGGYFLSATGDGISGSSSGNGAGVRATSLGGRGGILSGKLAQLKLVPSSAKSHPTSGQAGDLFFDAGHRLWLCLGNKKWKQLA